MMNESRIDIYNYVSGLLTDVSENVYLMNEPQELTESDVTDGFIVIRVGDMYDESEFRAEAYGEVRVFIEAYVPTMSRGRLNETLYETFENGILQAVDNEIDNGTNEHYGVLADSVLSLDGTIETNANNVFYMFVKSFVVTID